MAEPNVGPRLVRAQTPQKSCKLNPYYTALYPNTRAMHLIIAVVFFVSGAAALLFETVWFRLAGLSFGNSVWASSLVLASFMGGIALGNVLVARYGRSLRRPLLTYAVLECTIAVFGFGLVLALPPLTPLLAALFRPFLDTPWILNGLRLFGAFGLLLVPTTAMGATLPLLVRTLVTQIPDFGRVLGLLYGFNTLGAVVGALGGELVLLGALGVRGTGLAAAGLSLVAASSAAWLGTRHGAQWEQPRSDAVSPPLTHRSVGALAAAFLAGGILLALEVVWFRFLLLFIWGTSIAFAVMLAVVLLGIALGGLTASVLLTHRPAAHRLAPVLALAAGVFTAAPYFLFREGFGVVPSDAMVGVQSVELTFGLTLGLTFPTSFLSGVLFTLIGRALREEIPHETVATATLTVANTLGAMLGSLLGGFVLLPFLGVERSFFVLSTLYVLVAASAAAAVFDNVRAHLKELAVVGGVLLLCLVLFPFGLMENFYLPLITGPYRDEGAQIVAVREGRTETATYLRENRWGEPYAYQLVTNGHSMSGVNPPSKRYMSLFAQWLLALRPDAERALLISYGVGTTAAALTDCPSLKSIDVVDISSAIVELSLDVAIFPDDHPLEDPRVQVHIEDGRFFLQSTDQKFDVITGEPPPPKNAGIINLYTKEYFRVMRDRLTPGGLVTYWLPVYQMLPDESRSIARAFCDAFPDCTLWTGFDTEWMLAGSNGYEGTVSDEAFSAQWREPSSSQRLASIGVERPEQLGALFVADAATLDEWIAGVSPLVDNFPHRLDPRAVPDADDKAEYAAFMDAATTKRRFEQSDWVDRHWPPGLRETTGEYFRYQGVLNENFAGTPADASLLYEVVANSELRSLPLMILGTSQDEMAAVRRAHAAGAGGPHIDFLLAMQELGERNPERALLHLDRAIEADPQSAELQQFRIVALVLAGRHDRAVASASALRLSHAASVGPRFWNWIDRELD